MTLLILVKISKLQLFPQGLQNPFPWLCVDRPVMHGSRRDSEDSLFSEDCSCRSVQRQYEISWWRVSVPDPEPKHCVSIWSRH